MPNISPHHQCYFFRYYTLIPTTHTCMVWQFSLIESQDDSLASWNSNYHLHPFTGVPSNTKHEVKFHVHTCDVNLLSLKTSLNIWIAISFVIAGHKNYYCKIVFFFFERKLFRIATHVLFQLNTSKLYRLWYHLDQVLTCIGQNNINAFIQARNKHTYYY